MKSMVITATIICMDSYFFWVIFDKLRNKFFSFRVASKRKAKIPWLFTDFSLTKFYFALTKIMTFYDIFLFLQQINDNQMYLPNCADQK